MWLLLQSLRRCHLGCFMLPDMLSDKLQGVHGEQVIPVLHCYMHC
jgi:hypothetical protein